MYPGGKCPWGNCLLVTCLGGWGLCSVTISTITGVQNVFHFASIPSRLSIGSSLTWFNAVGCPYYRGSEMGITIWICSIKSTKYAVMLVPFRHK